MGGVWVEGLSLHQIESKIKFVVFHIHYILANQIFYIQTYWTIQEKA